MGRQSCAFAPATGREKAPLRTSRECNVKAKAEGQVTCPPFEVAALKAAQVASEARETQSLHRFQQLLRFTQPALESAFARGASATPSYSDTQQEGDQQGAERRFPRNVAQDAERHAGFFAFLDRVADATGGAPDSIGNFFNRGLGFRTGIQAFIHKRRGGHIVGHGRTS